MNELTYTRCGDYYIPDLKLSEQPEAPIGKYGRMRQRYLKEHRPGLYSSLILSEKLYPHLLEIDRAARERMDAMLPRMMEANKISDFYSVLILIHKSILVKSFPPPALSPCSLAPPST